VRGVTDSNVNGLRWGLDNRLHASNGGNGGKVRPLKAGGETVDLRGADFSFDPRTSDLDPTYETSGGFGLAFDEFGRSFSTYNIDHIQQRILPIRALERFPGLLPIEGTRSISDHGEMARIYPVSVAQTRPNHPEQAGHFSSAGGMGFIGWDAYPDDLYRSVVVGDVVGNLLHRDVLEWDGPVFRARRHASEQQREFLASRDPACRMVGMELGLDGALYVIDMQRDVIEHPDYIPDAVRAKLDLRAGEDRGRIYRIVPKEGLEKERIDLAQASVPQLVAELAHRNMARRLTAQRLLVQRQEGSAADQVAGVALRHPYAPGRVHALWTLHGLRRLDPAVIIQALQDKDEGVRENAVLLMEGASAGQRFDHLFPRLPKDSSPRVRFQLALALGAWEGASAQARLKSLFMADRGSYWMRMAAYCSLASPIDVFLAVAAEAKEADVDAMRELADLSIVRTEHPAGRAAEMAVAIEKLPPPLARAALEGLERGFQRRGSVPPRLAIGPALERIAEKDEETFAAVWSLAKALNLPETPAQAGRLQKAVAKAGSKDAPREDRLAALRLLRFGSYAAVKTSVLSHLGGSADAEMQREALGVLASFRDADVGAQLVHRWPEIAPILRPQVVQLLVGRKSLHEPLVAALEKGEIKPGELNLDLEQRRALLRHSTPEIKARAGRLMTDDEYGHRKAAADEWMKKLPARGDAARGRAVFETACAQCHRAGGTGHAVGPDLGGMSHRSVEDILFNIVDPNMAINPMYAAGQVETADGELLSGIVQENNGQGVTLLQAGGVRTTVARPNIKSFRAASGSLMPEGLEAGMSPAEMRDLIAFLQEPTKE
jgi:putative membrane-bound dehydrogenase-like protein